MPDTMNVRADLRRMLASGYPFDTPQGRDELAAVLLNILDILDGILDKDDDDLTVPFSPCVQYLPDADHTEMVLRDVPVINRVLAPNFSAGYDMETGDLVLLRVSGDITKR